MKHGDRVKIETKEETVEGRFMPSTREGFLVLKLDSGYNIGISEKKILKKEKISPCKLG